MQDTKLFETILGITTPWHVARVELNTDDGRVDIWLEHDPTRWPCPECGEVLAGFDRRPAHFRRPTRGLCVPGPVRRRRAHGLPEDDHSESEGHEAVPR